MRVESKHVQFSDGLPVIQGQLQKMPEDWCPLCMVCGETLEIPQPLRETLIAKVNVSSPIISCPKCNTYHAVADGQRAMVMGPADDAAPERPQGLVLGLVVTPDSLIADAVSGALGPPVVLESDHLPPGEYIAGPYIGPPQKPLRRDGLLAPCCTCGGKTESYCPDCEQTLCLKPGCEASHVVTCPPKKRASYL